MKSMKCVLSMVLCIVLLLSSVPLSAFAAINESDFSYSVLSDGTVKITQYNGSDIDVRIPAQIDGRKVSTIGNSSFYIKYGATGTITSITSIDIPEGVTIIEQGAFVRCTSLKEIIFPKTLKSIGDMPFFDMGYGTKTVLYCGSFEEWSMIERGGRLCDTYSKVEVTYDYIRKSENTEPDSNNHSYQIFDDSVSWHVAKENCEKLGGHLVTINSEEEQNLLIDLVKTSTKKNMWIGAYPDNGIYKWITGENFSYTNWASGEPNNVFNMQNAAMMYTQNAEYPSGTWNDENENGRNWDGYYLSDFGYICEWDDCNVNGDENDKIVIGLDRFSFGKDISSYVGNTIPTLLLLESDTYNTSDLTISSSNTDVAEIDHIVHGRGEYITSNENEHIATVYLKLKSPGNSTITITSSDGVSESIVVTVTVPSKEFRFYSTTPIDNINLGNVIDLDIGYYVNGELEKTVSDYILVVSDSTVVSASKNSLTENGRRYTLTAKKQGNATITVTHPVYGDVAAVDITVNNDTAYYFNSVPKMIKEEGKTTNFYNYSGMTVDGFSYKEHKDSNGNIDYYIVTMTVYNSNNLYGAVTAYKPNGDISGYYIIDKMSDFDTNFVSSLKSLYYSGGDLFYLINNPYYYSGKSISQETNVTINVPVGGHLSISNNVAVSEVANLANFCGIVLEAAEVAEEFAEMDTSGELINEVGIDVINGVVAEFINGTTVNEEILSALESTVVDELKNLNFDNSQQFISNVSNKIFKEFGVNLLNEIDKKVFSITGIASIGETVVTKILPTGWLIDMLYTSCKALDMATFLNQYCQSDNRLGGISIYAPNSGNTQMTNGITVTQNGSDENVVVHAYKVVNESSVNTTNPTFEDNDYIIYNITMYKNGMESQPSGIVDVSIPFPDEFRTTDNVKVYRINDDGTLTDMNATCDFHNLVFTTNHFSYYAIVCDKATFTVSGSITCFGNATDVINVKLLKDGKEVANLSILDSNYDFKNISEGTYILEVSKRNHVTRTYEITVSNENIVRDLKLHLLGDINGDGKVNITDVGKVNAHYKKTKLLYDYELQCADANNDGKVNITDVGKLNAHYKKTISLW